jgi:hypothetical protein
MELTIDKLYQVIGAQNVEILILRNQVAELTAQVNALTPAPTPPPAA